MNSKFNTLGLSDPILKAINEMGYKAPTSVQEEVIPKILERKDVIVMSKTGSGKTAVFALPLLELIKADGNNPRALILTPTRELAVQVKKDISKMSKYTSHKTSCVYGQHNINTEIQELKRGTDIICGTPGRVFDHIKNRNFNLSNIEFLILDEADRMLDMGFMPQVVKIIKSLPRTRSTLLFSATVPPEVKIISKNFMKSPEVIEIESETMTVDKIAQIYYKVEIREKKSYLNKILLWERPKNCIIFCNTKIEVDRVCKFLNKKGYSAQSLHGDIPQNKRLKTIDSFKKGYFPILVATDVAARGIHVDTLSLVINYDIPLEKDSYVHRIGRTGRAGNFGLAVSMVTADDLMALYAIEEHIGVMIEPADPISDEDLNLEKDMVDEWIFENRIKESKKFKPRAITYVNTPENQKIQSKRKIIPKEIEDSNNKKSSLLNVIKKILKK